MITEPQVLGGIEVSAATLETGRLVYKRYCLTCHGKQGDGKGPAAKDAWPPPRDFRSAKFKFTGVQDRGLPDDIELARVIRQGLEGTTMRPWSLRDSELDSVIQYIKTFSPEGKGFRSKRLKIKSPVIPPDPFGSEGEIAAAIQTGEKLYHATFECSACHPSYASAAQFARWDATMRPTVPFASVPKYSENYQTVLLPPDFLRHDMRAVRHHRVQGRRSHNLKDLYRSIAYGLQGPMPGYGHLGEDNIWAVAHYVKSLADQRDTSAGNALLETRQD